MGTKIQNYGPLLDETWKIAYLAAIIDTVGFFFITSTKKGDWNKERGERLQWHSGLRISSNSEELILWIKNNFGGSQGLNQLSPPSKRCTLPEHSYHASGPILDYILTAIEPYVIVKKNHCELMKEYRLTCKRYRGKNIPTEVMIRREILSNKLISLDTSHE